MACSFMIVSHLAVTLCLRSHQTASGLFLSLLYVVGQAWKGVDDVAKVSGATKRFR